MKWWNTKVVLDFTPFLSAIIIMAVVQGFNVLFIVNFVEYFFDVSIMDDKYYIALPIFFYLEFLFLSLTSKAEKDNGVGIAYAINAKEKI